MADRAGGEQKQHLLRNRMKLFRIEDLRRFKGGGGGTPAVPAPAPPPPSQTQLEVTQAKIDTARQAKAKKGVNSTILAGAALGGGQTNPNQPTAIGPGKNILLGGG